MRFSASGPADQQIAALSAQALTREALCSLAHASCGQKSCRWLISHSVLLWRKASFEALGDSYKVAIKREARMGLLATEEQARYNSVGG